MKKRWLRIGIVIGILGLFLFKDSLDSLIISLNHNFDYNEELSKLATDIKKEKTALQDLINIKEDYTYDFLLTKIKYRDVLDFQDTFEIYKGREEGIKKGSVVLDSNGLVGVVQEVDKHSSQVELITNKKSQISVKINNSYGILKFQEGHLIVSNITSMDPIEIGDEIYTSGLGNLPGGLYIGSVQDLKLDTLGIEKIIYVESPVDFNQLIYLLVLT